MLKISRLRLLAILQMKYTNPNKPPTLRNYDVVRRE